MAVRQRLTYGHPSVRTGGPCSRAASPGRRLLRVLLGAALAAALASWAAPLAPGLPRARAAQARQVVTSTTILQDLVRQVAGDRWTVASLLPVGADPHAYQVTAGDARLLSSAKLVVMVGAGLEPAALDRLIRSVAKGAELLELGDEVAVARAELEAQVGEAPAPMREAGSSGDAGDHGAEAHEDGHGHEGELDPHFWWSVPRTIRAVEIIAGTLARLDPAGAEEYRARASAYTERLRALDAWIRQRVATIPPERRLLVAYHDALAYLAAEYGFRVVGTVLPGTSTLAEASASETARLARRMRQEGARAIFAENTASPVLASQLSQEAGVRLVTLYTDSLGPEGSGAETYEGYMRVNIDRIVEALGGA